MQRMKFGLIEKQGLFWAIFVTSSHLLFESVMLKNEHHDSTFRTSLAQFLFSRALLVKIFRQFFSFPYTNSKFLLWPKKILRHHKNPCFIL